MERNDVRRTSSRCDVTLLAVVLCVMKNLHGAVAETVFFNSYGQCSRAREGKSFPLQDGSYTLLATGAMEIHETLFCTITFQAPADTGVCLTFEEFKVDDCGVNLDLYQGSTASGKRWKRLTCDDRNPSRMCTPERHVTLRLGKRKLNKNRGYAFRISVAKSSSFKGEDVILASSIGLFVGIIVGVVGFIVIIAVIVLCCCCKPCKTQQLPQGGKGAEGEGNNAAPLQQPAAQPTAPPAPDLEDEHTPLQAHPGGPLYPALPHQYPGVSYRGPEEPPPYAPPPYEQHNFDDKV